MNERLIEERVRLGLTQAAFADAAGVTSRAQRLYEKGDRHPDTRYMSAIAAAGADILYILTGRREPQSALGTAESDTPSYDTHPPVSRGDHVLLKNFHAAPLEVQAGIKTALGAFAPDKDERKNRGEAA